MFVIEQELDKETISQLSNECIEFVRNWKSHEEVLDAQFELYKNRILIFKNNQDINSIGGCATDKLFHLIHSLEKKYNISLLNRQLVAYENSDDAIQVAPLNDIERYLQSGVINNNTIIYNTAIIHSSEMKYFAQKLKDSWVQLVLQQIE